MPCQTMFYNLAIILNLKYFFYLILFHYLKHVHTTHKRLYER